MCYKNSYCLAAGTNTHSGHQFSRSLAPGDLTVLERKTKIKQMLTMLNTMRMMYREGMRVYNKLFDPIRYVKGGFPEGVKLELTSK